MAVHLLYIVTLTFYIKVAYLGEEIEGLRAGALLIGIALCLLYPLLYDGKQFVRQGPRSYLRSIWNYVDLLHILGGYANIGTQLYLGPAHIVSQSLVVLLLFLMLFKLFFFLRIYRRMSVITTMIIQTIFDLKVFLVFYSLLVLFFGAMVNVIGENPQPEYRKLNRYVAGVLSCLRITLQDFDFTILGFLDEDEARLYWVVWLAIFYLGCLIFSNFIIAEVLSTYENVKKDIGSLIYKERAMMVKEVEEFYSEEVMANRQETFPLYVVVRELESESINIE